MPNIYEEAKAITHDEIKDRLKKAYSNNRYLNNITIFRFHDYITQQELKEKRAKKVEELLGLYRLEKELKEKYHTSGSLYIMQHVLDELRDIAEEINLKEKELEEMK